MKYVIDKKNVKEEKLMYYNVKMKGLTVSPKNAVPGLTIKAKKITLIDIRYIHPDLLEHYIQFKDQDVLFLYSTLSLNHGEIFK